LRTARRRLEAAQGTAVAAAGAIVLVPTVHDEVAQALWVRSAADAIDASHIVVLGDVGTHARLANSYTRTTDAADEIRATGRSIGQSATGRAVTLSMMQPSQGAVHLPPLARRRCYDRAMSTLLAGTASAPLMQARVELPRARVECVRLFDGVTAAAAFNQRHELTISRIAAVDLARMAEGHIAALFRTRGQVTFFEAPIGFCYIDAVRDESVTLRLGKGTRMPAADDPDGVTLLVFAIAVTVE
jgi:hypothetical protein